MAEAQGSSSSRQWTFLTNHGHAIIYLHKLPALVEAARGQPDGRAVLGDLLGALVFRVVVGTREDLLAASCRVEDINWIAPPPSGPMRVRTRRSTGYPTASHIRRTCRLRPS